MSKLSFSRKFIFVGALSLLALLYLADRLVSEWIRLSENMEALMWSGWIATAVVFFLIGLVFSVLPVVLIAYRKGYTSGTHFLIQFKRKELVLCLVIGYAVAALIVWQIFDATSYGLLQGHSLK